MTVRRVLGTILGLAILLGATIAVAALAAGALPGSGSWDLLPVVAGGGAAALLAVPSWRWGRRVAGGVGSRGVSPTEVTRSLLAEGVDGPESVDRLCETLLRVYRLASIELWMHDGHGRLDRVGSVPSLGAASMWLDASAERALVNAGVGGPAWIRTWMPDIPHEHDREVRVVAGSHAGGLHAVMVLARPAGERFGPTDDRSLTEVGGRLGVLVHNRELGAALQATLDDLRATNEELRASRIRLVSTADAERRRIERDLHDGAQQHLAAVAVTLGLARHAVAADPSRAPELIDEIGHELREAIGQLRSLAHGIYPPLLISSGLTDALRAAGDRSPSPVTVRAESVGRYPSDVEAAVYFCCLEALQNAAKHAAGAAVTVQLSGAEGTLTFSIEDDGPGFSPESVRSGHGLVNMSDRIGAIGGTLTVSSDPSRGVRVVGVVPVEVGE